MAEIKFLRGSSSNWNRVEPKIESYFYLVSNEDSSIDLYLGEKLLAKGTSYTELTAEVSRSVAEDERLANLINSLTTDVEGDISSAVTNLQSLIQAEQSRAEGQEAAIRTEFANADSALSERIKAIEDDYLVEADKTELSNAIIAEKERAEEEEAAIRGEFAAADTALKASILGGVSEDYDTLAELAAKIGEVESAAKSYSLVAVTEGLSENVKEAFKLVDEDGLQVGETIKVYKDSALQKAELVEQELQFTYLLADGTTELVKIDVSKFLSESEFKNGLEVSNNVVSVKLGDDTETNKNYLDFEGDVEGEKSLVVRSIDTDSTKLQKDLRIAGLASQFGAGNYKNNDVIPAGTDLYTILQNFLCKELWPTNVTKQSASASSSMSNLTLTLSKTGTQEVGTLVKLTEGKTNGSSASSLQNSVLSGLEYGYSFADDNSIDSSATTITKTISTAISDDNYTVSATINSGFNADAETNVRTTPTTVNGVGSAALEETTLGCIVEGENKITINATGASYSYSAEAVPSVYYISNLGNTNSAQTHDGIPAVNSITSKPTKSTNATVTGSYYYFLGYSEKTAFNQFDSASVRALTTKSNWIVKDSTTTIVAENEPITSNGKSIVIACPSKYKLASIANGVGADILANFSSVGEVDVTTGSIVTKYKVYVYPITNGATVEFKKVTLTKA